MTYELTDGTGLAQALQEAGSWAALSRNTDIAVSTLKSRGKRFGVERRVSTAVARIQQEDGDGLSDRGAMVLEADRVFAAAKESRKVGLESVLSGKESDLDTDAFMLAVESDTPLARADHERLLRTASLAIQYYRVNPGGDSQAKFLKKVAATCCVDPEDLKAYCLVLGNEIRYRERKGTSPLENLPKLVEAGRTRKTSELNDSSESQSINNNKSVRESETK
jgi:hypothetical protein